MSKKLSLYSFVYKDTPLLIWHFLNQEICKNRIMKSNIWLKIETFGLCIGLISAVVSSIGISFWSSFSEETHKLFYGGEPGAIIVGILIVIGVISSLFFVINLFFKRFSLWWLRLLGFLLFYFAIATIGASSI